MNRRSHEVKAHVIFDNDGTLIESEAQFLTLLEKILPKFLKREISLTEINQKFIPSWEKFLENLGFKSPLI